MYNDFFFTGHNLELFFFRDSVVIRSNNSLISESMLINSREMGG
jgi:hypothetical protein